MSDLLPEPVGYIEWVSGVSLFDRKPFVQLRLDGKLVGQLDVEQTREIGMNALGAAEAAETDALILSVLGGDEESDRMAASLLVAIRGKRGTL